MKCFLFFSLYACTEVAERLQFLLKVIQVVCDTAGRNMYVFDTCDNVILSHCLAIKNTFIKYINLFDTNNGNVKRDI